VAERLDAALVHITITPDTCLCALDGSRAVREQAEAGDLRLGRDSSSTAYDASDPGVNLRRGRSAGVRGDRSQRRADIARQQVSKLCVLWTNDAEAVNAVCCMKLGYAIL